ncbi:MAG TPA: hypothetical protein VK116_01910, partial [Planctomycetota bacterium]|nr:hypothetical protein [Planctomycetota bacterium]
MIAGCPHRSPLWSPDGKRLLVLAGPRGESPDLPASELWLVDVEKGAAKRLDAPKDGARFLAGAWLDEKTFVIATGELAGEETREGSEAWWKRSVDASDWTRLDIPPPSGARIPKRLPVVLHSKANGTERIVLVYPTGWEDTIAIELEKREELWRGELTEIAGRGPEGGFIAQRETAAGGLELVSFDGAFSKRWSKSFSELREELAKKRGARPVDIVFNDAWTSHLPFPGARGEASDASERDWVGVVLWFSDVSWRDGVSGHYVRLAAKDGAVIDSVGARGLPGKPASVEGQAWG